MTPETPWEADPASEAGVRALSAEVSPDTTGKNPDLRDFDRGKGLPELGFGGGKVLVGDVDLGFERVQLRITKDFPPLPPGNRVPRLRLLPAFEFLVGGGDLGFRPDIVGAYRTCRKKSEHEGKRHTNNPRFYQFRHGRGPKFFTGFHVRNLWTARAGGKVGNGPCRDRSRE